MNENKGRSMVLTIIAIATLALIAGAATFAFFATRRDLDNGVISANVGTAASMYSFSAASNGNIEMNILFNEMSEANVSNDKIKTDNATIDVSLASPREGMLTRCTYDIVWVWDSEEKYTTPDVKIPYIKWTKEFGDKHGFDTPEELEKYMSEYYYFEEFINDFGIEKSEYYEYEFSAMINNANETDLSKLPTRGNKVVLQKGTIASSSTTPTTKTYIVTASIYNLPVDQTKLFNKSFKAHVTIDNLDCNIIDISNTKELATYIKEDVYTADGENGLYLHDGEGSYTNADLEIGDNSYRYAGANPNNYVCFADDDCIDDNLYRIIGVIDGKVKLIKYTNDGGMAWDFKSDGTYNNTWKGSLLEGYLNSNATSFTYYTTKRNSSTSKYEIDQTLTKEGYLHKLGNKAGLIEETTWSVGGFANSNLSNKNAQEIYNLEVNPENKITYTGKIGLMYVSEYMYAAEPTYWNHEAEYNATNGYNLSEGNDWILTVYYPWTISPQSDVNNEVFQVMSRGHLYGINVYWYDRYMGAVYPTFSLSSEATIIVPSGADAGSKEMPYIITKKAKYWNNDFVYEEYTHPNTPSTTYGSVAELQAGYSNFANRPFYIKTTEEKHETCLYYNNNEFCLSKGYWETDGETTKEKIKAAMEEALGESVSCSSNVRVAYCNVGEFSCSAWANGLADCGGNKYVCNVDSVGNAYCL